MDTKKRNKFTLDVNSLYSWYKDTSPPERDHSVFQHLQTFGVSLWLGKCHKFMWICLSLPEKLGKDTKKKNQFIL